MEIYIEKLKKQDAEELFVFECYNREFFEKTVPSRGEDYYVYEVFQRKHDELLKEQEEGTSYFYLIRNLKNRIVGRINLVDIEKEQQLGYLGYRVGEEFIRKGIAVQAVKLLLGQAKKHQINEIYAKTTKDNLASQKVLEKTGFSRVPLDQKTDFIHYIWKQNNM
ncbi:GNAT family N-acetyltransferase [Bacillus gaemokensis]|uniref:Acetyltransferase n=1 Tax=Bacillus gaemokensis TaxID=574375 RepID=A0A073KA33_9BACI|nr:GNAT family N-acetyltransferase [Bacillus gaemokensis]KEK23410.1 acetyltransferase [Bacillus gaemokensis]KYG25845.1 acetyltransferase [Bacillus gaemokensis]